MDRICLHGLCPEIFGSAALAGSDVWRKNYTFEKGKSYLIEAASGTGKSSLCSYLLGYRDDYRGQLLFDDCDARTLKIGEWADLRRYHVSYLFQDLRLFPELTALENIELKNRLTRHKTRRQLEEWLDALGIGDKRDTPVGKMSFGQQQRVAMLRALSQPFDFIIADEPVSHLDESNIERMKHLLMQEMAEQGAGAIVTSIGRHWDMSYDAILHL